MTAGICGWLLADHQLNALILLPSIIAASVSAAHITKMQAPYDGR